MGPPLVHGGESITGGVVSSVSNYFVSQVQRQALENESAIGSADAAYKIAMFYGFSEFDREKFVKWLKRADELGSDEATLLLANYYDSWAKPPEPDNAYALYCKLAKHENAQGMAETARMLEQGLGVQKDETKAQFWYEKAARLGKVFAMEKNSQLLFKNKKTYDAYVWARVAAVRRMRVGAEKVKQSDTTELAQKLTSEQVKQANADVEKLDITIPWIDNWCCW